MSNMIHTEPLRLLTRIIQLFSLTKNLSREQWQIVQNELWSVLAQDLSLIFEDRPLVQFWSFEAGSGQTTLVSSSRQVLPITLLDRSPLAREGSIFDINESFFLYIEKPFLNLSENEKSLLAAVIEHLRIAQEWRNSLERGFEIQYRIDLLHKVTVSIRGSLNLSEVLATTARDLGQSLRISRCFIRRYDPDQPGKVLATEEEYCEPGLAKAADIIFDFETEWMKNLTYESNRSASQSIELISQYDQNFLYIRNVDKLAEHDHLAVSLAEAIELKTFLGVPLLYKGIILGSLCFHHCRRERFFEKHELEFICQVADEATVAIAHAQMYDHIKLEAKTDGLTGLFNKASFHDYLEQEVERSKRSGLDLSVILVDMDYLKKINDTYGHMVGDEMIRLLGSKLKQVLRQVDTIARFGGDEFGVILPDTPLKGAKQLAERLVDEILISSHPLAGFLSASLGVAGSPECNKDAEILIDEADKALYLAKKKGRGRFCASDDSELEMIIADVARNAKE
ncbi:MAG: sensor domain-containing diguanylate cyclase [Candidatus Caenarcaniphilales bacterium]|nr:sensor domain-containing diguanylate cyclase [Candidatus Caenarcaniphilales bacterium]